MLFLFSIYYSELLCHTKHNSDGSVQVLFRLYQVNENKVFEMQFLTLRKRPFMTHVSQTSRWRWQTVTTLTRGSVSVRRSQHNAFIRSTSISLARHCLRLCRVWSNEVIVSAGKIFLTLLHPRNKLAPQFKRPSLVATPGNTPSALCPLINAISAAVKFPLAGIVPKAVSA